MGLLEMLVQRKLDERDQWKQEKQSEEALANTMVAKGNLSPAQLEVIRQIGNKWGSQALMNYYGEALPTARASEQQALQEQQLKGNLLNAMQGGMQQPSGTSQPSFMPQAAPQVQLGPPTKGPSVKSPLWAVPQEGDDFSKAVNFVFQHEGGYANDPADRGGPTNFGIASKAHPGLDVTKLTKEQAQQIYQNEYWKGSGADQLPGPLSRVHFATAVAMGPGAAQKILAQSEGDPNKYIAAREQRYNDIIANDPTQEKFRKSWFRITDSLKNAVGQPMTSPEGETQQPPLTPRQGMFQGLANMPGVTITMPAGGGMGISVDTSKLTPDTQARLGKYVASLPPSEQQAYDRALAQKELYGTEPLLFNESTDVRTGLKRIDIIRKSDGMPLGTHYPGVQTQLTPQEQVMQAGAKASEETTAKGLAEMGLSNLPIAQTPGGPTKPYWQVEAERKAEAHKLQAQVSADITKQQNLQPVYNALALLEPYSQKVHTGEGAGRILAGVKASVQNMIGQGAGKSYNDYENAFLGVVARVYGAERGVLTDRDVVRAKNLLPSLFAGKEFSEKRFQELRSFINELEGRGMAPPVKAGQYREGHVYPGKDGTFAIYRGPGKWELME